MTIAQLYLICQRFLLSVLVKELAIMDLILLKKHT